MQKLKTVLKALGRGTALAGKLFAGSIVIILLLANLFIPLHDHLENSLSSEKPYMLVLMTINQGALGIAAAPRIVINVRKTGDLLCYTVATSGRNDCLKYPMYQLSEMNLQR